MSYMEHLIANLKVAVRCLVMSVFHAVHGIIPCRYTSHEYWNIGTKDTHDESDSIASEVKELERLLAAIPYDNAIDRMSLEARLESVKGDAKQAARS